MKKTIYLDNAATTPLDERVLRKMMPYMTEFFGNADSPHAVGRKTMTAVDLARDTIAGFLHAKQNEIYFTSGGTEADNWAIFGAALAKGKEGRRKIVCSPIEHHAVLSAVERLRSYGFEIVYLPVNEGGRVELSAVENAVDDSTALVCVMLANNETGVIQPVKEIAQIAHAHGALCFSDAVQYAPYYPVRVDELGVDLLSISAHKMGGPKGMGLLYIKNGVKMEKLVAGGEQERGMRGGTLNTPSIYGFAEAFVLTTCERARTQERLTALAERFMQRISALDGITRNGEGGMPWLMNLRVEGVDNAALLYKTDLAGLCIAAGSACASASVKPSHVLTAMGLSEKQAKESVRISLGKCNDEEDVDLAADIFIRAVNELRAFEK